MTTPMPNSRRITNRFALFLGLQITTVAAALWLPSIWMWVVLGSALVAFYIVGVILWPWIIIPAIVTTTALDITGRLVKETPLGIPVTGFHIGLLLMVVGLTTSAALKRRVYFPSFELVGPLTAFLGIVAVSLTYSPNQPEATISFMRLVVLSGFLYLTTVLVDSRKALHLTIVSISCAMMGGAILGIVQILTQKFYLPASFVIAVGANAPRATGTFHNPNTFGTFMMVGVVFLSGVFTLANLGRVYRLFILLGISAAAAGLTVTFSRSNWLAALIGLGVILFSAGRLRHFLIASVVFLLGIFAVKEFVPFADYIFTRFISIFTFLNEFESIGRVSSSARIYFVMAGLGMFLDHPLLGAGWRAFPVILDAYKPSGFPHWIPTRESHTLFATIIAELGLLGALAAGWLVWRVLSRVNVERKRVTDPFLRGMLISTGAVFIAFQVSLSFTSDYGNNFFWFFTGLVFAVINIARKERDLCHGLELNR